MSVEVLILNPEHIARKVGVNEIRGRLVRFRKNQRPVNLWQSSVALDLSGTVTRKPDQVRRQ
jgi:hypothetical protein